MPNLNLSVLKGEREAAVFDAALAWLDRDLRPDRGRRLTDPRPRLTLRHRRMTGAPTMTLREFQKKIEAIYLEKDKARGTAATYMWFAEEVGELTRALRRGHDRENLEEEFADVLAWLASLASIHGIDLEDAANKKYATGCPYCHATPCSCD